MRQFLIQCLIVCAGFLSGPSLTQLPPSKAQGNITFITGNLVVEDLKDLREMYERYSVENAAGWKVLDNFYNFFTQDWFHLGVVLATLFCLNRRSYKLIVAAFVVLFLLLKNRQNLPLFYYQAMSVYPLLAAILAVGINCMTSKIRLFVRPGESKI